MGAGSGNFINNETFVGDEVNTLYFMSMHITPRTVFASFTPLEDTREKWHLFRTNHDWSSMLPTESYRFFLINTT
uniref:Sucrose-6-phosphate hydrolase n=1 Tax=Heterorhabditis bacteriophora TaxID=37862 RepID=A0A1I7XS52_HETBA